MAIDLSKLNLRGADLRGAQLAGALLDDSWLAGADLSGADLSNSSLNRSWLAEATLDQAEMVGSSLREAKQKLVQEALEASRGNITEAARRLGVHTTYLHRLLHSLGLRPAAKSSEAEPGIV